MTTQTTAPATAPGSDILDRPTNLIVVGVDHTPGSREAARWAGAEAARRHASLRLVSAFEIPAALLQYDASGDDTATWLRDGLSELHASIIAELGEFHPGLSVSGVIARGNPITLLRKESEHAAMLVVATRDGGRALHVVLGSVAMGVASTCPAPVVVIRPGTEVTTPAALWWWAWTARRPVNGRWRSPSRPPRFAARRYSRSTPGTTTSPSRWPAPPRWDRG